MIRFLDQYDWVVLGENPGCLLGASLVARLGLSVLVLPSFGRQKLQLLENGHCFDPESNFLPGYSTEKNQSGLLGRCLTRAGFADNELQSIVSMTAGVQVLTRSHRIAFPPESGAFRFELERELGSERCRNLGLLEALSAVEKEIGDYWHGLPERLTLAADEGRKRKVPETPGEMLERLQKRSGLKNGESRRWTTTGVRLSSVDWGRGDRPFSDLMEGMMCATGSHTPDDPELIRALHSLVLARSGARVKGGMSNYRDLLLRVAKRSGVHVAEKTECRRIFVENQQIRGIQVSQQGSVIGVRGMALGCDLREVLDAMSWSGKAQTDELRRRIPTPVGWKFTISLLVHSEAVPPGIQERAIWKEMNAPALEMEIADPADYGVGGRETRIVHLRTVIPYEARCLDPSWLRLVATRMLRQVMEVFPFLEYHVVQIFPDFRMPDGGTFASAAQRDGLSGELGQVYAFRSPEEIPSNLLCFNGTGAGTRLPTEGLFLVGDQSYPELGALGSVVAALESTAWLAHRSGLAGPLI